MVKITVRLNQQQHRKLAIDATEANCSMESYILWKTGLKNYEPRYGPGRRVVINKTIQDDKQQ